MIVYTLFGYTFSGLQWKFFVRFGSVVSLICLQGNFGMKNLIIKTVDLRDFTEGTCLF